MTQKIRVCDDDNWHMKPGEQFLWKNHTDKTCKITEDKGYPGKWPFTSASYQVPPGQEVPGQAKNPLSNGTYVYDVDCCEKETMPKNVLVP